MIDVEPLVQTSFDRMLPERVVPADWEDVLERAGVRRTRSRVFTAVGTGRRRYVVALLALLALVAVVGAAYALGHPIVRFSSAPRDTSRTVVNFFGRMTLFGPGPKVLPHQARRITDVRAGGRDYVLKVAPVRHGGYCYAWSNSLAGCADHRFPLRFVEHNLVGAIGMFGSRGGWQVLTLVGGSFLHARTARIVLTYADGKSSEIPFVWVTAPIRAGFDLYGIQPAQQRLGHEATRIALLDPSGQTLYSQRVFGVVAVAPVLPTQHHLRRVRHNVAGYPPLTVPAPAEWTKRQQLFSWRTETGMRVGPWIAPDRNGGTCYWSNRHSGCGRLLPNKPGVIKLHWNPKHGVYDVNNGGPSQPHYWFKVTGGHGYASLCCTLDPRARRVKLSFQDGDHVTLTPKKGYLIWPIPRRHYGPGHRLDDVFLYDARGKWIGGVSFDPRIRALYPCAKPKNYGYGFKMCP